MAEKMTKQAKNEKGTVKNEKRRTAKLPRAAQLV